MTGDRPASVLNDLRHQAARLRLLLAFALIALGVFYLSRLVLFGLHADRITLAAAAKIFARGWRFDMVIICAACLPVVLAEWLAPARWLAGRIWQLGVTLWLTLFMLLFVFNEMATPPFVAEFGVRPNRAYVEYLDSPVLVFQTIWLAFRPALLLGGAMTVLLGTLTWWVLRGAQFSAPPARGWMRLVALAPVVWLVAIGVRGGDGHRPLAPSSAAFSTDPLVNELALNSTYSSAYALADMLSEHDLDRTYGTMPRDEVIDRVRRVTGLPMGDFDSTALPSDHELKPTAHGSPPPNLVIVLQESLGAEFVPELGGEPVAQRIGTWRTRSLWFDNLYATGTRSARGIEAVITGFLPTRAKSVLKLEGAQHEFFTIARALKSQGYRTEFLYGGDPTFDNMERFFLNNGFDEVIGQDEIAAALDGADDHRTTWGIADEFLYRYADRRSRHRDTTQPVFTLIFSTSNHPPFDFPDGRVALYESPKTTHPNAARYADWALDQYLTDAKASDYWADTVFLVAADHSSRPQGPGIVPVLGFHIPAFLAGGPVAPRIVSRVASQIDLLPTALSVLGIDVRIPATGIDQTRNDLTGPGHAVMQFNDSVAYRVGDQVVMLAPDRPATQFRIRGRDLLPESVVPELYRDALAQTLFPLLAYQEHRYAFAPTLTGQHPTRLAARDGSPPPVVAPSPGG